MWTMRDAAAILGALLLLACGGEGGKPPAGAPAGGTTPPAAGTLEGGIRPELLTLSDWEWFTEAPNRLSRIAGQVLAPGGEPVPGAVATLLVPPPVPTVPAFPSRTVVADESGKFEFTDVPFNCWVQVRAPGLGGMLFYAPELQPRGERTTVAALPPAGEIRGVVRGPGGEALGDVEVMVSNQGPRFAASVRTDEQGRFVLTEVPVGNHRAWLLSERYRGQAPDIVVREGEAAECEIRAEEPALFLLKVVDARTGKPVAGAVASMLTTRERLLVSDESGVIRIEGACFPRIWIRGAGLAETMFELVGPRDEPRTETVALKPGGTIRGKVLDEAGRPIAGARVEVIPRPESPGVPVRGPLSGPDGSFEVSWIPLPETEVNCGVVATWPGYHLEKMGETTLRPGTAAENVVVTLSPDRKAKVRVVGPGGEPEPWAVVGLKGLTSIRAGVNVVFQSAASGTTGPDGTVLLSGLAPGPTEVEVRAKGHIPVKVVREIGPYPVSDLGEVRLDPGLTISGRVRSTRGKLPRGARIRLSTRGFRDALLLPEDGSFSYGGLPEGRVRLRFEAPGHEPVQRVVPAGTGKLDIVLRALSDLAVAIDLPENTTIRGWLEVLPIGGPVRERDPVVRELDGRVHSFLFRNLVAGKYRVRASAGDYYDVQEVSIAQGESAATKISFRQGVRVRGAVLSPDGQPVAGVGVSLVSEGPWGRVSTRTGRDGRFLFRGIPPGKMSVRTHPPGFAPLETSIRVAPGEEADVKLTLRTGGRILLSVKDDAGRPLPGIRISLVRENGEPARYWVADNAPPETSGDGTLVLTGLAAGDYELSLFRGDTRLRWGKVSVEENSTTRVKAFFRK